jgi:sterol 24-C-methyltransferase
MTARQSPGRVRRDTHAIYRPGEVAALTKPRPSLTSILGGSLTRGQVKAAASAYQAAQAGESSARKRGYQAVVNGYYDLVTGFFEYGWGRSFHFAPRYRGETFAASLARHEMFLAARLALRTGMRVLDAGCGIGGPMFTIARFSGAEIVGVNIHGYQVRRASQLAREQRLDDLCKFVHCDFMRMPMQAETYDAAYAIEALVHAPDPAAVFAELHRVLKPGGELATYEWCLTEAYDPANPAHNKIRRDIELGTGLPGLSSTTDVVRALRQAGFEVLEARDLAPEADEETPWYLPLTAAWTVSGFRHTSQGRWLTHNALRLLEAVRAVPPGASSVETFLRAGADSLVRAGRLGIFTPMFFVRARKPGGGG